MSQCCMQSEDSLQLVLDLHHVVSGDRTQVIELGLRLSPPACLGSRVLTLGPQLVLGKLKTFLRSVSLEDPGRCGFGLWAF